MQFTINCRAVSSPNKSVNCLTATPPSAYKCSANFLTIRDFSLRLSVREKQDADFYWFSGSKTGAAAGERDIEAELSCYPDSFKDKTVRGDVSLSYHYFELLPTKTSKLKESTLWRKKLQR